MSETKFGPVLSNLTITNSTLKDFEKSESVFEIFDTILEGQLKATQKTFVFIHKSTIKYSHLHIVIPVRNENRKKQCTEKIVREIFQNISISNYENKVESLVKGAKKVQPEEISQLFPTLSTPEDFDVTHFPSVLSEDFKKVWRQFPLWFENLDNWEENNTPPPDQPVYCCASSNTQKRPVDEDKTQKSPTADQQSPKSKKAKVDEDDQAPNLDDIDDGNQYLDVPDSVTIANYTIVLSKGDKKRYAQLVILRKFLQYKRAISCTRLYR